MQTKISKWGGSAAVRIPKMALESLALKEGELVDLRIEGNALILCKSAPKHTLEDLVAEAQGVTPPVVLDDAPQGFEAL